MDPLHPRRRQTSPRPSRTVCNLRFAYSTLNGAIDTVTYPSGLVTKKLYSAHGYLCRVTDGGGSHTCTTTADSHVLWTMNTLDAELHLTSQTSGNAAFTTTQTFGAGTGLLDTVRAGPSNNLAAFNYTYDALGNLTYRTDDLNSVFERYCYDGLNRLTTSATKATDPTTCSATGAGMTAKTIAYDQVGNITSKNDVGTYSYPSPGSALPHAISSITGTVNGVTNPSYTYDSNGNMTAGAGRTVTYTAFNMAASIVQGTIADCLSYDSNHARIKMEVRASTCGGTLSATTCYLNDPVSGAMSEKLVAGGTTTWHDYVTAGGGIIAERFCTGATPCSSGATWSYFVLDHLGSTAVLTNSSGTMTEQLSYDAWGRRRNVNGTDNSGCSITSATSRGYTGHEMLDSLCEINANARIYDPTIARFMSADSIVPDGSDGQSFNRYSYVNNGPLSATDSSGYAPRKPLPPALTPTLPEPPEIVVVWGDRYVYRGNLGTLDRGGNNGGGGGGGGPGNNPKPDSKQDQKPCDPATMSLASDLRTLGGNAQDLGIKVEAAGVALAVATAPTALATEGLSETPAGTMIEFGGGVAFGGGAIDFAGSLMQGSQTGNWNAAIQTGTGLATGLGVLGLNKFMPTGYQRTGGLLFGSAIDFMVGLPTVATPRYCPAHH